MLACVDGVIQLNFIDHKGLHVQAMALDCRTILGPYVPVASVDTLRRMLVYLGATPEQLEDFNRSYRRWGQGGVPGKFCASEKDKKLA